MVQFVLHIIYRNQTGASNLQYNSMKSTLFKTRNINLPAPPNNSTSIRDAFTAGSDIIKTYGYSDIEGYESAKFYETTKITENHSYTIFVSHPILDLIKNFRTEQRTFLCDGTFKVVPQGDYTQLLIIYIEHQEKVNNFKCTQFYINFFVQNDKNIIYF
jgi:hypothetical protein